MTTSDIDVIDARGLRCPLPVIRLAQHSVKLQAGAIVTVLTTDPAAKVDIPAWARMRGHLLLEQVELDGHLKTIVELS